MSSNKRNRRNEISFAMTMCRGDDPRALAIIKNGHKIGKPELSLFELLERRDKDGNTCLHYALQDLAEVPIEVACRKAGIAHHLYTLSADPFIDNDKEIKPIDMVTQDLGELFGLPYRKPRSPYIQGVAFRSFGRDFGSATSPTRQARPAKRPTDPRLR